MPASVIITYAPFDLPPFRYKGRSRRQWKELAETKLLETANYLRQQLTSGISIDSVEPLRLVLSIDIRTMVVSIDYSQIKNSLVIEMIEFFLALDRETFNLAWAALKAKYSRDAESV